MDDATQDLAAERLRVSLELIESGFVMKRQQLRRRFPDESEAKIDERFRAWLHDRPMDAPGRPMTWEEWKAKRRLR
jgi:hypothetical protein